MLISSRGTVWLKLREGRCSKPKVNDTANRLMRTTGTPRSGVLES
jgi:hypothetical protein